MGLGVAVSFESYACPMLKVDTSTWGKSKSCRKSQTLNPEPYKTLSHEHPGALKTFL